MNTMYYHAHVYFDATTVEFARQLRSDISHDLGLKVGNFHQRLVGPHQAWSFEVDFTGEEKALFTKWVESKRQDLTILIHAVTGDDYLDHTKHVEWLGQPLALNLSIFN